MKLEIKTTKTIQELQMFIKDLEESAEQSALDWYFSSGYNVSGINQICNHISDRRKLLKEINSIQLSRNLIKN